MLMYGEKVKNIFAIASKICVVMIAAAIVLSTAATNILFITTIIFSLAAGNWQSKFKQIIDNPISIIFLLFYALFLFGTLYSTAPWPNVLLMLRKYDKFLLAVLFLPLFAEERWRNYAINAFLAAILVMLVMAYLKYFGWLSYIVNKGSIEVFKNSIEFNFLMAFAAYLCLFRVTVEHRYRWLWAIFLLLIVYTMFFRSGGRSGYFVFLGLISLFFFQKLSGRGLFLATVSVLLLFGLAFTFSPVFKERMSIAFNEVKTYHQNDNTSVGLRMSFVEMV